MGGYRDEYEEDLDEYEDEEAEGSEGYEGYVDEYEEGYEEEEADPHPPKEVQDYLVLRQRLKEEKRKQLKKELGTSGNARSCEKNKSILKFNDNYGSFFGSSQPIIAQRVIQESKSLLENPHLLDKAMKPRNSAATKGTVSDSGVSKSQGSVQTPKVVNGVHKKVQMIKKIRDYSFLDSDDPEPPKDNHRKAPTPKSEACTAHSSEKCNKDLSSSNGRNDKKSTPINGHTRQPNVLNNGSRDHRYKQTLPDSRKQLPVNNGSITHDKNRVPNKISSSGPGRPMVSKIVPASKIPAGDKRVQPPPPARSTSSISLTNKTAPSRPHPHPVSKTQLPKQQVPNSKQSLVRREHEDSQKPKVLPKQVPHAHDELRKSKVLQKVLPKQAVREELRKPKVVPKQGGAPVLKPKVTQPPPRSAARPVDDRSRKRLMRPHDDDEDGPENVRSMIRSMFGYNPSRYGDDEDVSDMEANFEEIEREEKRSARIARKEDEEELRKIEEEEKRERLRKEAKKRKLH